MPQTFPRPLGVIALWALFFMPLTFAASSRFSFVVYAPLILLGLWTLACRRPAVASAWRPAWPVVIVFVAMLPYEALSIVFQHGLVKTADNGTHFLLFVILTTALLPVARRDIFWLGLSAGSLAMGLIAGVQHFVLGVTRVYGTYGDNPVLQTSGAIKFAMVSMIFCLLSVIALADSRHLKNRRYLLAWRSWHALGAAAALLSVLLTQSRGPLLALFPAALAIILAHQKRIKPFHVMCGLLALLVLGTAFSALFWHSFAARTDQAVAQFHEYRAGDVDTSVGARLAMWKTAWQVFLAHPWFGFGLNQFGVALRQIIDAGGADPSLRVYDHPHNEYFEALACGGVVGVIYLGWLLLAPLTLFIRQVWGTRPSRDRTASLAGVVTVLCFMIFAATDCFLDRQVTTSLYAFLVLSCAMMASTPPAGAAS
jgi:O-antigen ligase